jgi:hypothetical protein
VGTYVYLVLKDRSEENIRKTNNYLKGCLGVDINPFYSYDDLQKDLDFLNNDPEGLHCFADFPRPISMDVFLDIQCFSSPGQLNFKLNELCTVPEDDNEATMLETYVRTMQWAWANPQMINHEESSNYTANDMCDYFKYDQDIISRFLDLESNPIIRYERGLAPEREMIRHEISIE